MSLHSIPLVSKSEARLLAARGYNIKKKLGEGSYAKVYLSEFIDPKNNNKPSLYACKIINISAASNDFIKKFLPRELDLLSKINHPHIVYIQNILHRHDTYYIFMRYAENGDLLDFIMTRGAISESQSRIWMRQLGLALQYLHEQEIAHRDLKCENALITSNYNLKLSDFGFARVVIDSNGQKITSQTYCGSLSYTAPEVLRGQPYYPKISDMWSLGVILYIMLNKSMPFNEPNIKNLYEQQIKRRWKFRSKIVNSVSKEVIRVVKHLLEPDTKKRWDIRDVLNSDWIAMDANNLELTAPEKLALQHAKEARKKLYKISQSGLTF